MDWYDRWKINVTTRHHERAIATMRADVFPKIGNMQIDKIEPRHIIEALSAVEKRESLEQLKKTKSFINMVFAFAVDRSLCKFNPSTMVSNNAFMSKKKKSHKAVDKDKIYQFFDFFENERFSLSVRLCTEFVLRTMTRVSESAHAEWSEYDKDNKRLVIPAERMKMDREHIIPLSNRCVEILDEIKTQSHGGKYIFPNRNFTSHLSETYPLQAIKRAGIDSTIHGLRSLASTIQNETGKFRHDAIEACLAHEDQNSIRATYNRAEYMKEREEIMIWWSEFLDMCKTKDGNAEALKKFKITLKA